ncbi:DNA cytosine methyltransferase [Cerasibacillus sp. JNUCC 74]
MRSTAKDKNKSVFIGSFGRTNDPFPTLLAGSVNNFSFWYEGEVKEGYIRQLTPLECDLMGLPEGWTALGHENESISDYARYKAIGNAIAVPCAEYIMAGIAEVYSKSIS